LPGKKREPRQTAPSELTTLHKHHSLCLLLSHFLFKPNQSRWPAKFILFLLFQQQCASVQNQEETQRTLFWRNESPREHLSSSMLTWVEQLSGGGRRRAHGAAKPFIFVALTASAQHWWIPCVNTCKKQTGVKPC